MKHSTSKLLATGALLAIAAAVIVHAQQAGVDMVLTNG